MEEDFLLAGKRNTGVLAFDEDTCAAVELTDHHLPLDGVMTQHECMSIAIYI